MFHQVWSYPDLQVVLVRQVLEVLQLLPSSRVFGILRSEITCHLPSLTGRKAFCGLSIDREDMLTLVI
jgi:hypothetical protein